VLWERSRDFQWWNVSHSFLFTFFPGILQNFFPSPLWAPLWVCFVSVVALALLSRALSLSLVVIGAALAASLAFPSYFALGYPYISGFLPYAAALCALSRFRAAPPRLALLGVEVLAALSIHELSFHCYEMGKTFGVVYLAGAVLFDHVAPKRRFLWGLLGVLSLAHVGAVGGNNFGFVVAFGALDFSRIPAAFLSLLSSLFVSYDADWPVLLVAAGLAAFALRKDKMFWILLLAFQYGLLVLGAMQAGTSLFPQGYLVPRRMLLLTFLSALVIAEWWRQSEDLPRKRLVAGLLLILNVGAALHSWWWSYQPRVLTTLPYVSPRLDFRLDRTLIADAMTISSEIRREPELERVFLYDFNQHSENMGDPQAFPERLLLSLGAQRFHDSVRFLMARRCRFWCLPESVALVPAVWATRVLATGKDFILYVHSSQLEAPTLSVLKLRGALSPWPSQLTNFFAYRVHVLPHAGERTLHLQPQSSSAPKVQHLSGAPFCLKAAPRLEYEDFYRRASRNEIFGTTFQSRGGGLRGSALSQWLWTWLRIEGEREQTVHIEFEGGAEVQLLLDGAPLSFSTPGPKSNTEVDGGEKSLEVVLSPGSYRLDFLTTAYEELTPRIKVQSSGGLKVSCEEGSVDAEKVTGALNSSQYPTLCIEPSPSTGAVVTSRVPVLLASQKPESYRVYGALEHQGEPALLLFDALAEDDSEFAIGGNSIWKLSKSVLQQRALGGVLIEQGVTPLEFLFGNTRGMGLLRLDLLTPSGAAAAFMCSN
jgi:hypothetical protein